MAASEGISSKQGDDQPTHFVVEVKTAHGIRYAICQQLMLAGAGSDSLPPAVIEEFLARNTLRAAAIPTENSPDHQGPAGMHWMSLAQGFQSGRAPSVNINIYNKTDNDDA